MKDKDVVWTAVMAAICLCAGLVAAIVASWMHSWEMMSVAGVLETMGVGWALLAGREE